MNGGGGVGKSTLKIWAFFFNPEENVNECDNPSCPGTRAWATWTYGAGVGHVRK